MKIVFGVGILGTLAGCVTTPVTKGAKAPDIPGCCTNTRFAGTCQPSNLLPGVLECVPTKPAAPYCIKDPFKCDDLTKVPLDNCIKRDFVKGRNAPCYREVGFTQWDPNGFCMRNSCGELVPNPPAPAPPPQNRQFYRSK